MKREAVLESRKVMNQKGAAVMKVKTDRESRKEWSREEKSQEEWIREEKGQEGKHQEEWSREERGQGEKRQEEKRWEGKIQEEKNRERGSSEEKRKLAEQRRQWKRELKRAERDLRRERKKRAGSRAEKGEIRGQKGRTGGAVHKERERGMLYDLPFTRAGKEIPIKAIKEGIIYTEDGRYVKILEVLPINFLHRSAGEQRNIIYSFMGYLKIAPPKLQIKSVSKKADISGYLEDLREDMRTETDERCRMLQQDYGELLCTVGYKEAVTRRFFLVFQVEARKGEKEAVGLLNSYAQTAKKYLYQCGNEVVLSENPTVETAELLYTLLNRKSSQTVGFGERLNQVAEWYFRENGEESVGRIPIGECVAPKEMDFRHGNYVVLDGVYHSYLFIPSGRYRFRVPAGWMSLLINAGEGIDVDLFLYRQDKGKTLERIGRRIRLNRSKIKDASDTNSDFDDLAESIQAGYYLKNGLSSSEEFYYLCVLVTVTGYSAREVEWRAKEMKKLLNAQDMDTVSCVFKEEQGFRSALPLLDLDRSIFERSKRNVLTSGAASCYPFTSFEMSDRNGILMGVNTANSSLVIVDIFNSAVYKNANISIMGTTGAGKTFLLQLMALRMRRKKIQVFIIAPDKGHEFARACTNIGGEFIKISSASANCINVMEIRKRDKEASDLLDGAVLERSELAAKIQDLHIFFSLLVPDMDHEEKQLLDEALVTVYYRKGITHENGTLLEPGSEGMYREMPVLGDVYEILCEKPETRRMANIVNRLVHGSASSFNQQTNVDLGNKYVVLDISELTGDLLPVGMFVALDYVWSKVKEDRTVEKAVFLDEVWQLIGASSNELAAEYVLEIFKIIRGYGGSAVCATQDLSDFMALKDGKYGRGIINACKTKVVLNLENDEAKKVQELLHLSEAERMEIVHFERGKGMISTNSNNLTLEFKASQLEKDLITTDRKDLKELKERLARFGSGAYGKRQSGGE